MPDHYAGILPSIDINRCALSEMCVATIQRQSNDSKEVRINLDKEQEILKYLLFPSDWRKPWFEETYAHHYRKLKDVFELLNILSDKSTHQGRIISVAELEQANIPQDLIQRFGNWLDLTKFKCRGSYLLKLCKKAMLVMAGMSYKISWYTFPAPR